MDPDSNPSYSRLDMGFWVEQLFSRFYFPHRYEFLSLMRDQLRCRHLCCIYFTLDEKFHPYNLGKGDFALRQEDCSDTWGPFRINCILSKRNTQVNYSYHKYSLKHFVESQLQEQSVFEKYFSWKCEANTPGYLRSAWVFQTVILLNEVLILTFYHLALVVLTSLILRI